MRKIVIAFSLLALVVTVAGAGWAIHSGTLPLFGNSATSCCYEGSPCCTPDCCTAHSPCCEPGSACCTPDCCSAAPKASDCCAPGEECCHPAAPCCDGGKKN